MVVINIGCAESEDDAAGGLWQHANAADAPGADPAAATDAAAWKLAHAATWHAATCLPVPASASGRPQEDCLLLDGPRHWACVLAIMGCFTRRTVQPAYLEGQKRKLISLRNVRLSPCY